MMNMKIGLLFLSVSLFIVPSSAKEEERYAQPPDMLRAKDVTAILVSKFREKGKSYFAIIIRDLRWELPSGIYKTKYYNSLEDVFTELKKIQIPIQYMKLGERNFYVGERAKELMVETGGIRLEEFTPSEQMEMGKMIKDILGQDILSPFSSFRTINHILGNISFKHISGS